MKLPLLNKLKGTFSGTEIGIPINIISKIATDVNFKQSILTKESILFNFLLGFSTYKQDRLLDANEYFNNLENNFNISFISSISNISNISNKHNYYQSIIENEKYINSVLFCSYISICIFAIYYHIGVIFPLFTSTFAYKELKKNDKLSFLKPVYVAGMWTFCCCVLPLMLQNNYDSSMISFELMSPTFLNLFAMTNLADLKDYEEDFINGINTLPIILGQTKTKGIILISAILSSIMFINSPYFTQNFQNYFFLSSNILPYFSFLNITKIF